MSMADRIDDLIQDPVDRAEIGKEPVKKLEQHSRGNGFRAGSIERPSIGRPSSRRPSATPPTNSCGARCMSVDDLQQHVANLEQIIAARDDQIDRAGGLGRVDGVEPAPAAARGE